MSSLPSCSFFTVWLLFFSSVAFGQDAGQITRDMFSMVKSIKYLRYNCESNERVWGKMKFENSDFKLSVQPFKIYVFQNVPRKGVECLYVTGVNGGKAKVNPNAFPWISLNLGVENDIMLEDRHHSIFDAGFLYTASLLEILLNKYTAQLDKCLLFNGIEKVSGSECYHLTFSNPNYKLTLYTTAQNETPVSIAKKLHINFYSIIENNKGLTPSGVIKPNTRLIVSNDYASKMEVYVHKEKMYPVHIKVYDAKGLFEEYKFLRVEINPTLLDIDFSATNPKYKFK